MKALTIDATGEHGFGGPSFGERLAVRGRLARQEMHRAATVLTVFALVGGLHVMRWAGLLVL